MADSGAAVERGATGVPKLVVVCGPPGVGKTTVSEGIVDRIDGELLRTDVVRNDVAPDPEYTPEERERVYDELFDRGRERVQRGENVVLDGTFQHSEHREEARALAAELGAEFRPVKVECAEPVVRQRIRARENDESDADFGIHEMIREQFDPLDGDYVTVDNSETLDRTERQIDRHF